MIRSRTFGHDGDRPAAGTVIPFPPAASRRTSRGAPEDGAERGRILFFTGVRYERLPDTTAEAGSPKRKRS